MPFIFLNFKSCLSILQYEIEAIPKQGDLAHLMHVKRGKQGGHGCPTLNAMNPQPRPRSAFKEISLLWQSWWRRQTPSRQDRFAFMGPLTAVIMFFAAISSAFWYLRYEEMERERESVRRDVESAQQQLRLRLIERQEQMMRLARDAANGDMGVISFSTQAETLVAQFP